MNILSKKRKIVLILSAILLIAFGFFFRKEEEIIPRQMEITKISQNGYAFTTLDDHLIKIEENAGSPSLSLEKWSNDINFSLTMPYDITSEAESDGNKLSWNAKTKNPGEKREVIFSVLEPTERVEEFNGEERASTQHKNGGVKFDIILQEEPSSNVFEFDIDSENLDFYYQDILTEQEMQDQGIFRPENVMGSYAVYHSYESGHKVGGTNYKTGKAFHIYRPLVYDADGVETWGELNIDEEQDTLSVTVDEEWLSEASYPVTVDPTFGYTEVGESSLEHNEEILGDLYASHFEAPENMSAYEMSVYFEDVALASETVMELGIYDENHNLIEKTEEKHFEMPATDWYDFDLLNSAEIDEDDVVYLAMLQEWECVSFFYDDVDDKGIQATDDDVWGYPYPLPDSIDGNDITIDYIDKKFSIYATYEPVENGESDFPDPTETGYFIERDGNEINLFAPEAETREISIE